MFEQIYDEIINKSNIYKKNIQLKNIDNIIKQILKEEFSNQMCKSPEVNNKFKEYKYYRVAKCGQNIFKQELNDIKKIKNYPYNVVQSGKYKGKSKNEVLKLLQDNHTERFTKTCGGYIFKGNEPNLKTIGYDPCNIQSIIDDYTKNIDARKAYNRYMGYPENEDIFSGGPIAPMK